MINSALKKKKMTKYQLSKLSKVPYTTICDICNNKTSLSNCRFETAYRICKALNISLDTVANNTFENEYEDFELFKSNICHYLKEMGDMKFIHDMLTEDYITQYFIRKEYDKALYLLAMVDYISKENNIELCTKYDELRNTKLKEPIYPASVIVLAKLTDEKKVINEARKQAIPEFLKYNIIESDIRNVA